MQIISLWLSCKYVSPSSPHPPPALSEALFAWLIMQNFLCKKPKIMCGAQLRSSIKGFQAFCGHSQLRYLHKYNVDESLQLVNSRLALRAVGLKERSRILEKNNSEQSDVFTTWKGWAICFPSYTFFFINLSEVKRRCKCCLEYSREVNALLRQNYGKLFPRVDFVKGEGWKYKLVLMFKLRWKDM